MIAGDSTASADSRSGDPAYGPLERRALQSIATQFWVNGVVFASFIPRLPEIRSQLDITLSRVGLLLTLAAFGGLLGSALCGPTIERFGTKRTLIGAGVPLVAALSMIGMATSPWVFLAALAVLQMSDVMVDVAMNIQGSRLSALRSAPVINRLHGLWSVGSVVGSVAATQVASAGVSLRVHLFGVAVVLLATMLFVAPGLLRTDVAIASADRDVTVAKGRRLGRGPLVAFGFLGGAAIVMEIITSDWAAFRLSDDFGVSAGRAGFGFVAFTVGMVIGRLAGDSVMTRIGPERLLRGGVLLASFGLVIATLTPTVASSLTGFIIAGSGVSVLFPRLYDDAARLPGRTGAGLGALTAGSRVAGLSAPIIVGTLADSGPLTVGAAIAIVTLPCAIVMLTVRP